MRLHLPDDDQSSHFSCLEKLAEQGANLAQSMLWAAMLEWSYDVAALNEIALAGGHPPSSDWRWMPNTAGKAAFDVWAEARANVVSPEMEDSE